MCGKPPRRVAVPAVWRSRPCAVPVARSALSRVITAYFWVYASGMFRDHESGPAAWGAEGSGRLRVRPLGGVRTGGESEPGKSAPGSARGKAALGIGTHGRSHRRGPRRGSPYPGKSAPGESVPGESVPGESAPGKSAPGSQHRGVGAREHTRESASGGQVKAPGRLSCGSPSHGRLLRRSDSRHGGHSRSAKTEGEPHGDRLDGPISPGVRCLPSIRRSPSCGT